MEEYRVLFHTELEFIDYWDVDLRDVEATYEDEFGSGRVSFRADYDKLPQRIKELLPDVDKTRFTIGSVKEHYPATFYVTW